MSYVLPLMAGADVQTPGVGAGSAGLADVTSNAFDVTASHLAITTAVADMPAGTSFTVQVEARPDCPAERREPAAEEIRTAVKQTIGVSVDVAVMDPETLPRWWGPDGFSCRTKRIDLRTDGEWVFDMIAPDGTVFPNHHLYVEVRPEERIGYTLLWGENGPKHADAWASFEDQGGATKVTLGMVFSTAAEFQEAKGFGAVELGQQTLGKLERFVASR